MFIMVYVSILITFFFLYKDTKYSAEYDAATLDEQPNAANELLK